jgi:glycine dehydrogenase subunit 1
MASLGKEGFREVATSAQQYAHYLADQVATVPGFSLAYDAPFFHEFVVRTEKPAADVLHGLLEHGILGGLDLGRFSPDLDHHILLCATELNTKAGIDRLVGFLRHS